MDQFVRENSVSARYFLPQYLFVHFFTDVRNALEVLHPRYPFISSRRSNYGEAIAVMAQLNLIVDGYKHESMYKIVEVIIV